ncbi:hypothetical protein [Streptomyces sp. SID12488]|uniref:hypothetical protein n=1 Tax=Streptomyces sp. SID12488 TaxID=2706040 RepID=UPI0013DC0D8C|nr:hypothetical protein [Streptomyces sp. SID12488]NEA63448.1 hypothetical protein [Streptomyces sp. SID12488]
MHIGRYWPKRREVMYGSLLLVFLRVLILAVVVMGLVMCADRVEAHYQKVVVYRNAPLCPAATRWQTADDCVAQITGEVVDAHRGESCTTDSNGVSSCTVTYSVHVRFGQHSQWLTVDASTYRAVEMGDRADLRLWHGEVVRMTTQGHTEDYLTASELASAGWLILAWLLLGATWPTLFGVRLIGLLPGWLVLTVPYLMVAYNLLGLNPMGVVGWSITAVLSAVGMGFMGRWLLELADW